MFTKEYLKQQIKDMGVLPTDKVVIHTSMKSIGKVEGGATTVIDAFREVLSQGLLMVPTHTWENINEENPIYDVVNTKACIGALPNAAIHHPEGFRSLHPTHSMKVFGKGAKEYIQGEENCDTPTPENGCWGRILKERGKIILIGVGQERNTFIHAVDEINNIPLRLTNQPQQLYIKTADGEIINRPMYRHFNPFSHGISEFFVKFEPAFIHYKGVDFGKLGNSQVRVCHSQIISQVASQILHQLEEDLCENDNKIPWEVVENIKL